MKAPNNPSRQVGQERNTALDFTKGALVLLMVLYHWINYFVSVDGWFYKYLRFITPSFIFITGFLVASVYLTRYRIGDPRLHLRLVHRGLKLLVLFTLLNLAVSIVLPRGGADGGRGIDAFLQNAAAIYGSGNGKGAAFSVLVPISYVLVLSSFLLWPAKFFKPFLPLVCGLLFFCIFVLDQKGVASANLELVTIGILGIILGLIPSRSIDCLAERPALLAAAYVGYLIMLTLWQEIYPLQVMGVCLSLMLIYVIGGKTGGWRTFSVEVQLLGRYTLLAYIAQIAVLVGLSLVMRQVQWEMPGRLLFTGFVAFALTYVIIKVVDRSRERWAWMDRFYKLVFA